LLIDHPIEIQSILAISLLFISGVVHIYPSLQSSSNVAGSNAGTVVKWRIWFRVQGLVAI
jgi:hypothetical protein